jgi:hypothetical protein
MVNDKYMVINYLPLIIIYGGYMVILLIYC